MSWHRRFPHQNLKARQDNNQNTSLIPGFQPTTSGQNSTPTATNTSPAGGNNGNGKGGDKNTTSSSSPSSPTGQPQSSNSATSTNPAQNGSSTTSTGLSSSSSTTASASSIKSDSSTSNVITTATPTRVVSTANVVGPSTSVFTYTGISASTTPPASTGTSSSSSSNSVGGMSAGALVGVIAGGLFGLICLIALGSYILRWWNKRSAERDFVDDYNAPDIMGNSSAHDFAPPMTQHHSSPSLSSGAGIAGQGVLASRAPTMSGAAAYRGGYGGYPTADDESINGPFSSQPQAQSTYNPESYGQYAPYSADAGYQEAMRGYQGQRGYEAPVNIGYAVPGPSTPQPAVPASLTPRSTSPKTTAAAAMAAAHAAAAAPASAGQRQSAAYDEEDAYGGF